MSLINCKVELSLTWNQECALSTVANNSTFAINDTKLYIPVVTLKTEDNAKLSKLLSEGFKRLVYWNKYNIIPNSIYAANAFIRESFDARFEGVKDYLFLLMVEITTTPQKIVTENIFFQELKLKTMTSKLIKEYKEVKKVSTGQEDD